MEFKKAAFALLALLYLCGGGKVHAQSTTGTIRGHVNDAQGLPLPGVTVSVTSPNLQGTRTAVTAENGDFVITVLPSGTYSVTFELSGFQRVAQTVGLAPTQDLPIKVELGPADVTEEVTVVGQSAEVLTQTAQVATNFKQELIASLPSNRDINALQRSPFPFGATKSPEQSNENLRRYVVATLERLGVPQIRFRCAHKSKWSCVVADRFAPRFSYGFGGAAHLTRPRGSESALQRRAWCGSPAWDSARDGCPACSPPR